MKKNILLFSIALLSTIANAAWEGLSEDRYYSGPKITESDLTGKVVLVEMWGVGCAPCRASLPKVEELWQSFKTKPFMIIGSHCQGKNTERVLALVKENKLTYPIYEGAGIANAPGTRAIPFYYVVNHRGKVVHSGNSLASAIEAVVNALGETGGTYILTGGIPLKKYKSFEKQLTLGKNIKNVVKKLEADVKKAEKKTATQVDLETAKEAKEILSSIETTKTNIQEDIEVYKKTNPPEALKTIKAFTITFPTEGAKYKDEIAALSAQSKEWLAKEKEKEELLEKAKKHAKKKAK